jgi:hypothetical protein
MLSRSAIIGFAESSRFDGRSLRILLRGVPACASLHSRSRRRSDIESERLNPVAHPISSKRHPASPPANLPSRYIPVPSVLYAPKTKNTAKASGHLSNSICN